MRGGEGRAGEGRQAETQERPCEDVKTHATMKVQSKLCYQKPRDSKNHQALEKTDEDPPLECVEGEWPCPIYVWLLTSRTVKRINLHCFEPPHFCGGLWLCSPKKPMGLPW